MPLKPGSSRQVISTNIREMRAAGHPQNQAIAAALRLARQGKAAGGEVTAEAPDTFRARFAGKMQDQHPSESVYEKMPPSQMIEDRRGETIDPELEQRGEADMARQYAAQRMRNKYYYRPGIRIPQYAYGGQIGGSTGGKGSIGGGLSDWLRPMMQGQNAPPQGGQQDWLSAIMNSPLTSQIFNRVAPASAPAPQNGAPQGAGPPPAETNAFSPPLATPPVQGNTCPGSYAEGGGVDDEPPPNWMTSGLTPTPPKANFASEMDPFERAAYGVRRRYGTESPGPPDLASPDQQKEAALMLMGPVGAAIQDPRGALNALAPGLGGSDRRSAGEVMSAATGSQMSGGASGETPQDIMLRQQKLKEGNFYNGEIDGKDGPSTQAAQKAFEAAEKTRIAAEERGLAAKKAGIEETNAATAAENAKNEKLRLEKEEKDRLAKIAGSKRYLDLEKDVPLKSQIIRDYATPVGIGLGAAGGAGIRYGLVKGTNLWNKMKSEKAESLFAGASGPVTAKNMGARSQNVNQFWRTGGAGPKEVPYTETPTEHPGIAFNENPKNIGDLYPQPNKYINPGTTTDASLIAGGIGESLFGQFKLQPEAQARLKDALDRMEKDPTSEPNQRELQAAKDNDAMVRMITNIGRGAAGSYFTAAKAIKRTPFTPAMEGAGSERLAVDKALRAALQRSQKAPAASPASPAPPEATQTVAPASTAASPPTPTAVAPPTAKRVAKRSSATSKAPVQPVDFHEGVPGKRILRDPFPPDKYAEGGGVGGLGDADEIAGLRAAIEEENQRTQRAGTGLRYKREFENEHRASPFVSQIERSGNRIEGLSDRLEALLPNPLLGPYPKEQPEEPPYVPQGPEAPPPREAIVDAPSRQRDYWDMAKKVMFGDPDAMVDSRVSALNRIGPSSWEPEERDYIADGVRDTGMVASPTSGIILRGPAAVRRGLAAGSGGPSGNPTGSMLNASRMGGPPSPRGPVPGPSAPAVGGGPRGAAPHTTASEALDSAPIPRGPWNPAPGSALAPAAGRTVRGTMIPVERVGGKYQSLNKDRPPREPRDPNAMPTQRRLPGPGRMDTFAVGGPAQAPWFSRDEARHMDDKITGPLAGPGGGRTDRLPISVPSGSYVVPADIVSGLGQGNTANGMQAMQKMFFNSGPYGTPLMRGARGRGPPRPPRPMKFADGGGVPIMAADGEFIVPPEKVIEIGGGDMDHGHNVLDHFVKLMRQQTIKTLSSLPDPQV